MSLRKILEELSLKLCVFCKDSIGDDVQETHDKELIDLAHQQILALIPEKDYKVLLEKDSYGEGRVEGFNQAIDEITHNLTKDI